MNQAHDDAGTPQPLLDLRGLTVEFDVGHGRPPFRAVDGVNLRVAEGETVGLVGESGSGKSTIGRAILGLTPVTDGTVRFAGADITHAGYKMRRSLSADMQVVFQDPYSSLNPTRTIGQTLAEALHVYGKRNRSDVDARVRAMLERVGLSADASSRYPIQFSGGQRQRIAIARALIVKPRLVVCDEPVSSLDLSVQAQVLNLLGGLQRDFGVSYLFVAHDLAVVRHLSHRIVVLYRGRIMEEGEAATVYDKPAHPYTKALLASAPVPDPAQRHRREARQLAQHNGAGGANTRGGCPFATRCPHVIDVCRSSPPELETTQDGSQVACHRWRELSHEPHAAAHLGM